jgi:uncharacterized protein DUF4349
MRLITFSARTEEHHEQELEAALAGEGPAAAAWVELREDVRALTPRINPDYERLLGDRIAGWRASEPPGSAPAPAASRSRSLRLRARWQRRGRLRSAGALGGVGVMAAAVVIAIALFSGGHSGGGARVLPDAGETIPSRGARASARAASGTKAGEKSTVHSTLARASASAGRAEGSAPARVQQLAASITLSSSAGAVQSIADRIARLTVADGGFVQSSQVQLHQPGTGEANLQLKLPSARLAGALASIGQLAPMREESQSLQDITDSYDAARRGLGDAVAARQALLRALAAASTQGQIDSLRAQLALAGGAITRARSALQAVSARAAASTVEVTVLADTHARSEGTLERGLHELGAVLTVALVVILILAGVLVPLAALLVLLVIARRGWRRYARERALDR